MSALTRHAIRDNSRQYSQDLWAMAPLLEIRDDSRIGFVFEDDFLDLPTGKYTATQATTGTFALQADAGFGGVAQADCNSVTATQGINVQLNGEAFVPAANRKIWFECRIKVDDMATGPELFVGLSETDTAIIDTSANASANHIGWQSVTDDGVLLFSSEKAGTGATQSATTLVDGTYVKLGFYVDGVTSISQYINGVKTGTAVATANIPIVGLTPSFVCQSGGTTDPILSIDWVKVALEC